MQSYRYDSLYRLTEAKETSGAVQNWIQNWEYDRYGNRTGFTQNIAGMTNAPTPMTNYTATDYLHDDIFAKGELPRALARG